MKEDLFNQIGRKLPYVEEEGYVDALVGLCTDHAISVGRLRASEKNNKSKKSLWIGIVAAAAVAAIAVTVLPGLLSTAGEVNSNMATALAKIECTAASVNASDDLSTVLSEMSYDQLTQVSFYITDDVDYSEY